MRRTEHGWLATSPERLLAEYLAGYPSPGGAMTYWYGLDPVIAQPPPRSSSAPSSMYRWRSVGMPPMCTSPGSCRPGDCSTDRFVDLSAAGFSPATEAEHTRAVQIPADPIL
ncbi:hypothetical protein ACLBYD_29375 [Rhodococcus sp. C26F]